MIYALFLAFLVASVSAQCDQYANCTDCVNDGGCSWYLSASGPFGIFSCDTAGLPNTTFTTQGVNVTISSYDTCDNLPSVITPPTITPTSTFSDCFFSANCSDCNLQLGCVWVDFTWMNSTTTTSGSYCENLVNATSYSDSNFMTTPSFTCPTSTSTYFVDYCELAGSDCENCALAGSECSFWEFSYMGLNTYWCVNETVSSITTTENATEVMDCSAVEYCQALPAATQEVVGDILVDAFNYPSCVQFSAFVSDQEYYDMIAMDINCTTTTTNSTYSDYSTFPVYFANCTFDEYAACQDIASQLLVAQACSCNASDVPCASTCETMMASCACNVSSILNCTEFPESDCAAQMPITFGPEFVGYGTNLYVRYPEIVQEICNPATDSMTGETGATGMTETGMGETGMTETGMETGMGETGMGETGMTETGMTETDHTDEHTESHADETDHSHDHADEDGGDGGDEDDSANNLFIALSVVMTLF